MLRTTEEKNPETQVIKSFNDFWETYDSIHGEAKSNNFADAKYPPYEREFDLNETREAAAGGNPQALWALADGYLQGKMVPHHLQLALDLYDLACIRIPGKVSLAGFRKHACIDLSKFFTDAEECKEDEMEECFRRLNNRLIWKVEFDEPVVIEKLHQLEALSKKNISDKQELIIGIIYLNWFQKTEYLISLTKRDPDIADYANFFLGEYFPATHNRITYLKAIKENTTLISIRNEVISRLTAHDISQVQLPDKAKDPLNYAKALYNFEQYPEAFTVFQIAAERGFRTAITYLAEHYHYGRGVNQDQNQEFRLYYEAAIWGDAEAQEKLGTLYSFNANPVPRDLRKSFHFFSMAANKGRSLGLAYAYQVGIRENNMVLLHCDIQKAAILYRTNFISIGDGHWAKTKVTKLFTENSSNDFVVYHATLALQNPTKEMRDAFNHLAEHHSEKFLTLMDDRNDTWETVLPLLTESVAKKFAVYETQKLELQDVGLPLKLAELVISYQVKDALQFHSLWKKKAEQQPDQSIVKQKTLTKS